MTTANPPRPMPPRSMPTPGRAPGVNATSIDPFRLLRRHLLTISAAGVFGIILGTAAFVVLFIFWPLFSGSVQFRVGGVEDANEIIASDDFQDDAVLRIARTELALLTSEDVLRSTVMAPNVRENTEWAQEFRSVDGAFDANEAIEELLEELKPRYVTDTNLFEVAWSARRKEDVPLLLNTLRDEYLKRRKEVDGATWDQDLQVFTNQKEETQQQIDTLQREIEDFVRTHDIFTLEEVRDHPLAREMEIINLKIQEAQQGISVIESNYAMTEQKLAGEMEPSWEDRMQAEQDQSLRLLLNQVSQLKMSRRAALDEFSPEHMQVKALNRQIEAAEAELEIQRREVIEKMLNAYLREMGNRRESYLRMVGDLEAELAMKNKQFQELAAQVSTYQSKVEHREQLQEQLAVTEELIQEMQRVRLRAAAQRVQTWTSASTPREASFPQPMIIIPLGFLLVVGTTIGLIFLRELSDTRVKSASDIEVVPGAKVLGVIPDLEEDPTRIRHADLAVRREPKSVIAESYRQLTTPVLKQMTRSGHQSLLVAGGMPGAGSTTVITNLAAALAATGKRALVIDANFRRPRLAEALGHSNSHVGLGDLLFRDRTGVSIDDTLLEADGIALIAAGTPENRVFERLNNGEFDSLMAEFRQRYDVILVDAPPAVVAGDALALANRTDASLLVVRANQEERGLVARLINQFNDAHAELLGIVLNRPRRTAGGYFKKNFATMADYASKASA